MPQTRTAPRKVSHNLTTLYMALELSMATWRIAFSDGVGVRQVNVPAWELERLRAELSKATSRFALPPDTRTLSVQEAGRDGFSVHRMLESMGIESLVVDSSSIEVNRRARRAKTDRLDANKLLSMLQRFDRGERRLWSVVYSPTEAEEAARRPHRERERLIKEQTALGNRIRSLLATVGTRIAGLKFDLSVLRQWDCRPLPGPLQDELRRLQERLALLRDQLAVLRERRRQERVQERPGRAVAQAEQLMRLRGIGDQTSWVLAHEFFWRDFRNRQEVGSAAGLTPSPFASGEMTREQGISKAGNARIRRLLIEAGWLWLRFQPDSALSRWFHERFGPGSKRLRRVGIVALARRLLIALWRYLNSGVIPEGALQRSA